MNEFFATLSASHGSYAHPTLLTCINCHTRCLQALQSGEVDIARVELDREIETPTPTPPFRATPCGERRNGDSGVCASVYDSSTAFIEISAFINFEIGQPFLALLAAVSNADWSAPGTLAVTSR